MSAAIRCPYLRCNINAIGARILHFLRALIEFINLHVEKITARSLTTKKPDESENNTVSNTSLENRPI